MTAATADVFAPRIRAHKAGHVIYWLISHRTGWEEQLPLGLLKHAQPTVSAAWICSLETTLGLCELASHLRPAQARYAALSCTTSEHITLALHGSPPHTLRSPGVDVSHTRATW